MGIREHNWKTGSDEYVYNMAFTALFRVICFVVLMIALAKHELDVHCVKDFELRKYLISLILIHLVVAMLNIFIMRRSMIGDIMDHLGVRKYIEGLIIFKVILLVVEAIWSIIIVIFILEEDFGDCRFLPFVCLFLVLAIFFVLFIYHVVSFIYAINLTNSPPSFSFKRVLRMKIARLKGREPSDFSYLSELLIDYFYNTNYQISDLKAGLIILKEDQESRSMFKFNMLIPFEIDPGRADLMTKYIGYPEFILKPRQPWMNLSDCLHFIKFAKHDRRFFKLSWIMNQTKLNRRDFIYVGFKDKANIFPFYIALDHKSKNIVASVADNQTLKETIKDMLKGLDTIESEYASTALVHKDLYTKAKNIFVLAFQSIINNRQKYPDYGLVTVGYGSGAGVASLLAFILRKHHPDVICYAFSPIGCIVSEQLAYEMEDFTLSIVFGDDIYARLSLETFRNLKLHLRFLVYSCSVPKHLIFREHFLKELNIKSTKVSVQRMDDESYDNMIKKMWTTEVDSKYFEGIVAALYVEQEKLYIPGKILFCKRHKNLLLPYWVHRDYFKEILASKNAFEHHDISFIESWLKKIKNMEKKNFPSVFQN